MEFGMKFFLFVFFPFAFEKTLVNAHNCNFPAIFNFGDSNSDTGGATVLRGSPIWPNGLTLGKENHRCSDGLLIIDYLAKSLGFPYLNSSVDNNGTSFKYGVNFAVGGQRINPAPAADKANTIWNYPFFEQLDRFFAFKSRAIASSKLPESMNIYPQPEAFTEGLYTIDIGQNDVNSNFGGASASSILDLYATYVKRLLDSGAKYFWIHNTGPLGCVPNQALNCVPPSCIRDKIGCNPVTNKWSQDFNSELKKRVDQLRKDYSNAVITLVDMYSAKLGLIANNNEFDKFGFCCGKDGAFCGLYATVNNKNVFGGLTCEDPWKYISWDGVHYTDAANKVVAKLIADGAYSEPRVAFANACLRK